MVSYMNFLFLPNLTERQWRWPRLVQVSQHATGMFERENGSCKFPTLSLGITPEFLCCAACCPCADMLLVRVSSVHALCNIFHLSSRRSATALQSQNLVTTNHVYSVIFSSFLLFGFYGNGECSLLN